MKTIGIGGYQDLEWRSIW